MEQKEMVCCKETNYKKNKGALSGILYGLIPHAFCIAFILLSVIGAVTAAAFLKKILITPYFFQFLIFISLLLATISSAIYLRKTGCSCFSDIKKRWKYIITLYSTTILVNLLMLFVVFPALANINSGIIDQEKYQANLSISVQIPCSGHAPLIIDELKKETGVGSVKFRTPNSFEIQYNPDEISREKIISLGIFKTFKAEIN